jgi:hypothetical protein
MATCKICGNKYYAKECNHCKQMAYEKTISRNNKIDYSKYKENLKNKNKQPKIKCVNKNIIMSAIGIFILTIGIYIYQLNTNPLIGTWISNTESFNLMPKITFTKDEMITEGMVSKVIYRKENNKVIVTDKTGVGIIYKIINKNTIESDIGGMKTIYKKVN